MPKRATLHEQKAQVLLEIGETWKSLKAATRRGVKKTEPETGTDNRNRSYLNRWVRTGAIQLEPSWAKAWVTLGRAQLNFGEPDCAIESFHTALAIKGLK
ncbi:hypothetical protein R6Q57_023433 [Mikania cordata]